MTFEICILAGGLSSRMGRDKAGIRLEGKGLLARVKWECGEAGWPVRVIRKDAVKRCGPLGGIYTGLKGSKVDVVIFAACDMPFVSGAQLQRVAAGFAAKTNGVFTRQAEFVTFPFAIRTSALAKVEEQIASGDFSLQRLARTLRAKFVRAKKSELFDIDTPDDLAVARTKIGKQLNRRKRS
jgi:molybdopterin-guanine dinucleotide biosynthesis protein A